MNRTGITALLVICLLASLHIAAQAQPVVAVAFYSGETLHVVQRQVTEQPSPALAAQLLLQGPTAEESASGLTSAVPAGTRLIGAFVDADNKVHIDVSREYLNAGTDDAQLAALGRQWFATFRQFPFVAGVIVSIEGKPLTDFIRPVEISERAPDIEPQGQTLGVSGKKIALSPGHGRYWNGSGWYYQRGQYCGHMEEDLRNLEMMIYLQRFLLNHGATVYMARQTDKNAGGSGYDGNRAWWQMASSYWLKNQGYACSIYASSTGDCNLGSGGSESSDDIRARPLMSDYHNTDIYVSLHTNGLTGYCTGSCPSGTETYYDNSAEHATWGAVSQQLGNAINPNIVSAINSALPEISPDWSCHGVCVKDSGGDFGEIRIPNRAATLTELGFHDTCDRDAPLMNDPFFRSVAMWGMYKGICQYFGDTPTPMYHAQYVSDDIPSTVVQGQVTTVHVTFKNLGVVWSEARAFRLGAVGDSDPFAGTRQTISGQVEPNGNYTFTFNMVFTGSGNVTTDWRMVRDGYAWFGDTLTKTVYVTASGDTEPPTVPQNLRVTAATTSTITLAWDPSTDNVGVYGYRVYRNGGVIGTTQNTTYTDTGLSAGNSYSYQVEAYDVVPNYSGPSPVLTGLTFAGLFSDGFDGSLANWILDPVNGSTALQYSTAQNHGSLPGAGSAYAQTGAPHFMYHWLDSGTQSLTSGGYRTGMFTCHIYDTQGAASGMRTGMRLYAYDAAGAVKAIYWIGVTNGNPPNIATHYIAAVWDSASLWTYYDLGARSTAWHKLAIEVLPYAGSSDLRFYLDDVLAATASQPADAANAVLRRMYLGFNYNVNADHYFDDITFDSSAPAAPSNLVGTPTGTSAVRWSFTDNAGNEIGDRIYNGALRMATREQINATYVDETGLTANTVYTRTAKSFAGVLESAASSPAVACTLSTPPSPATVTCSKATGTWYTSGTFQFTAVGGYGGGKISYYRTAWDQSPTHTWTGDEAVWATGTTTKTATSSANGWYFHVQGFNNYDVPNGTLDLGPYYFDSTPPSQPVVTDDGVTSASLTSLHASWSAVDTETVINRYEYAIGTTSGGTEVLDWTAASPETATQVTRTGLLLADGATYYISVKARNAAGLWSTAGTSDGMTVQVPEFSIVAAKALPDGGGVKITGRVVSAAFDGSFYIQETDRSSGIKVASGSAVVVGALVDVTGTIQTADGERYVAAISVTAH